MPAGAASSTGARSSAAIIQANLDFLARTNLLKPGDKVLEIGCGIGTVVFELTKQGYDAMGTDISQVAIEYGRNKYRASAWRCSPPKSCRSGMGRSMSC